VADSLRDFELEDSRHVVGVVEPALDGRPRPVLSATRSATDEQARQRLSVPNPMAVGETLSARYSVGQSLVQPMEVGGAYAGASGVMSATTSASYATEVGGEGIAAIPTVRAPSEPKQQVGERANPVTASGSQPRVGVEVTSGQGGIAEPMSKQNATPASADANSGGPGRKSLPTIKLGSYDGTTPLETFLTKLENCAE